MAAGTPPLTGEIQGLATQLDPIKIGDLPPSNEAKSFNRRLSLAVAGTLPFTGCIGAPPLALPRKSRGPTFCQGTQITTTSSAGNHEGPVPLGPEALWPTSTQKAPEPHPPPEGPKNHQTTYTRGHRNYAPCQGLPGVPTSAQPDSPKDPFPSRGPRALSTRSAQQLLKHPLSPPLLPR